VRRAGNQVRITGQLIHASDDVHLWAKSYDHELTPKEMFAIQAALATEIAGALQAAISPGTKKLLERRPTDNLAAYEAYLKARTLTFTILTRLNEREKFLHTAVELDPNFAEAWGELATTHAAYVFQRFDVTPARLAQADAAIAHAIRLAPDSLEVVRLIGVYAYNGYRDYSRAIAQFEKVIGLQPNNAAAILYLANVQRRQGRWLEALGNYRKAAELDPANGILLAQLELTYVRERKWDEALATRRRIVALQPDSLRNQAPLFRMDWWAKGSTKEAEDWLTRLTPPQFASPLVVEERKFWARTKGDYAEWRRLDGLQPYFDEDGTPRWSQATDAAMMVAAQGDMVGAMARLGKFPAEVRSALEVQPANERLWCGLALMEALLGKKEEALRDARKAVELMPEARDAVTGPTISLYLAAVYAWIGDKDRAVAELTRLVRMPSGIVSVHDLRIDPQFAPLRGDPRFEALLNDPKNNAPLF
jgi:tetratricopeptide (TPR) repeat protein